MRFVLISTHVDQTTGYSKVVYNLLGQLATLAPDVRTYHFGFQRHGARENLRSVPKGIVSYDAAANEDPKEEGFGFNKVHEYLEMVNPDVVMIYNDPLIIHKFIDAMKFEKGVSPYKLWLYVDQVYEGIAPPLIESMNKHADRIYLFTNHWKNTYAKYGSFPDLRVIENAVDTSLFSKFTDQARLTARQSIGIPSDAILMVNANRNTQRKRHDLGVMAFVQLHIREPDNKYYMMILTSMNAQHGAFYDIARIYNTELDRNGLGSREDLKKRLLLVDTSAKAINDSSINEIYNIADIGINTSDGEGFGLCQIEHLYTGAPQIVTDIGTYRDFMDDSVCEFIESRSYSYFSGTMPLGQISPQFSVPDITSAMQRLIARLSTAKEAAAAFKFKTWDEVCAGWIADIKSEIGSK